jgi:PAS domain-containing protein
MRAENMHTLALELSGALVLHLDVKGRIIDANAAAAQFLALEGETISPNPVAGDFFGSDIRRVLSETWSAAAKPSRTWWKQQVSEVSGTISSGG